MITQPKEALQLALCDLISDPKIGVKSILANQDAPRPDGQYASVNVPALFREGQDEVRYTDETGSGVDLKETVSGFRKVRFSVNINRLDALDKAEEIRLAVQQHWAREHMLLLGLALRGEPSEVRDLTDTEDAGREQRAQFDLFYHTIQNLEDVVLAIESVCINVKVEGSFHQHTNVIEVNP